MLIGPSKEGLATNYFGLIGNSYEHQGMGNKSNQNLRALYLSEILRVQGWAMQG